MTGRRTRAAGGGIGAWLALAGVAAGLVAPPPAAAQTAAPPAAAPLPALDARPRARAARALRAAQAAYEHARHRALPDHPGGAPPSPCEVTIGRFCYWDNNDESPPPAERPAAARARSAFLARLDSAVQADPGDDWAVGQRVRYLLEAGRRDDAVQAAAACRGTPWWCRALASLALHTRGDPARGDHAAALAAHDSAHALLPSDAARCAWDDLTPWLPPGAARGYRRLTCGSAERARYEARFWRLAQPFWALDGHDLRTELAARRTLVRLHGAGANSYAMPWGDDAAELDVRYGVPAAWSVRRPAFGSGAEPSVVGHEPTPSYDFTPDERTLRPEALLGGDSAPPAVPGAGTWALRRRPAQMRYAPAYAPGGVRTLDHQLARFRRGDTLLVVGAYELPADTARPPATAAPRALTADSAPVTAALLLDDARGAPAAERRRAEAPRRGALVAAVVGLPAAGRDSAPAWLASLEVLDPAVLDRRPAATPDSAPPLDAPAGVPADTARRGRAARARLPVAPLAPGALLSDVLLVRPGDYGPTPALAAVVDSAAGAPVVRAGALFGLYWEQYGAGAPRRPVAAGSPPPAVGDAPTVAITATRLGTSAWERLGALVGRPLVMQPVSLRYADPVPAGAPPGRYVALRWPAVPAGTYRLDVSVTPRPDDAGGAPPVPRVASLVVRVVR